MRNLYTITFDLHHQNEDDYEAAWRVLTGLGCYRQGRRLGGGLERGTQSVCWLEREGDPSEATVVATALLGLISTSLVEAGVEGFRLSVNGGTPESLVIVDRPSAPTVAAPRYNPFSALLYGLPHPAPRGAMVEAWAFGRLTYGR
jgi:hypothetical protein